jgi:hypothetical protein
MFRAWHIMAAHDSTPAVEYRPTLQSPHYRVGDDGSAWSCLVPGGRTTRVGPWHPIRSHACSAYGHQVVSLQIDGRLKTFALHRLILEAFVGPRPSGMQCRHLDGNPRNNRIENLRWGTPKEDGQDRIRHGTATRKGVNRGERNGGARLTAALVVEMRRLRDEGMTVPEIARRFGVSLRHAGDVVRGRHWGHL